jgi:archaellum biogenesis ATPase FlaH
MRCLSRMELSELIIFKDELIADIVQMSDVIKSGIKTPKDYISRFRDLQAQKNAVLKAIDNIFDELNDGVKDGWEFIEDIFERERAKLDIDDDGFPIIETVFTNIKPFDEYLFKESKGIPFGTYMAVIGESNIGKSDIIYMMIRGFLENNEKLHFHSFEVGTSRLYRSLSKEHGNKLKGIVESNDSKKKMFSVDTKSSEWDDLERMINIRYLDGCRIFIIDSLTKVTINKELGNYETISDRLLKLAHNLNVIIIIIGQRSKYDNDNNNYVIFGSVMVQHHLDTAIFIDFENPKNRATSERMIWMEKHRDYRKKGMITSYISDEHSLSFVRESDGNRMSDKEQQVMKNEIKKGRWANAVIKD